jgi:hypothetical protein
MGGGGQAKITLLAPTPHYVNVKCCDSDEHVTNWDSAHYENYKLDGFGEKVTIWMGDQPVGL